MKRLLMMMMICLICIGISGCLPKSPTIEISDPNIIVEVNDQNFSDESLKDYIKAYDYKDNEIPFENLTIMGNYDLSTIGNYPLTITATSNNNSTIETVNINVVDLTKPIFNVVSQEILVYLGTDFNADPKMNLIFANDNYDQNITDRITYTGEVNTDKVGLYPVIYTVSDTSGNISETTVNYHVTDSMEEFAMFLYKKTIAFYWGDYFIVDQDKKVLNYDDAVYYMFTNDGQSQFERACGLAVNSDNTAQGIQLTTLDGVIYMYDQERIYINNYLSTTLNKTYEKGIYLNYRAIASYGNGITTVLTQDNQFNLKKVAGKWYVDDFALPN